MQNRSVVKRRGPNRNHGRVGAAIARPFLFSLGFSAGEVAEICFGIAIHVDDKADFEGERTPPAVTVGDADNIDRFDAYRIYEELHLKDYMNLPLDEQRGLAEKMLDKLARLREFPFGTATATEMWREKIDYRLGFYRKLLEQFDNSSAVNI